MNRLTWPGLPFVRIIHGKGTGRLRQVIREQLDQSPHVKNWESGGEKEGGDGVTVAGWLSKTLFDLSLSENSLKVIHRR